MRPFPALLALEMADEPRERRLRIGLPGVVLVVALLYFVWVGLLATRVLRLNFLEPFWTVDDWARSGAALFVVLLLVLIVQAFLRRQQGVAVAPAWSAAPVSQARIPDELVMTGETVQGQRVLEYSKPPKSEHHNAVYAKCLVPVDKGFVLRVEDLVAEAKE
ncbi:MAG: hypothetical protein LC624_01855 [Halobacteriales archaeon]|nr:hypothetical protein [Halobacteriales archaeon]